MGIYQSLSVLLLLYCTCGAYGKPSTSTTPPNAKDGSKDSAEAMTIPDNMNIADYYFSIFGKHLDYDDREPLLTFDEPVQNEISEELETETSNNNQHFLSRQRRFLLVPANFYNATRRWSQQMRRLRLERRRRRLERRRQWQQNRIKYLTARSEALQKQASRVQQQQQRLYPQTTRNAAVQPLNVQKISNPTATPTTTTLSTSTKGTQPSDNAIAAAASNSIPVKQVPVPIKTQQ